MITNGYNPYGCWCQSISGNCETSDGGKTSHTTKHVTPMYLLNMFFKTKQRHHNLTQTEKVTLAALITYINGAGVALKGYEAYPTGSLLEEYTGLSIRTIENNRKTLQEKGWMKVITGKGDGHANHYFINAKKIAQAYVLSHPEVKADWYIGNTYELVKAAESKIKRNTQGLKRGAQISISAPSSDRSTLPSLDIDRVEKIGAEEVEMEMAQSNVRTDLITVP